MIKIISSFLLVLVALNLNAKEPKYTIKTKANVTDLEINKNILFIATDAGIIQKYNINTKKFSANITIPTITDFFGNIIKPKIYDIDYNVDKKELLIVSQGNGGFANVYIYNSKKKIVSIIDIKQRLMIKRAIYYNNNEIMLGLLSNEIIKYKISNNSIVYRTQISSYTFSGMCISPSGDNIISSDESGRVNVINCSNGEVLIKHNGENLDNVYQIDYKGNIIATAGQDRKLGIYKSDFKSSYSINSDFLIYSVGLNPDGSKVAYSANERNEIRIIDVKSKNEIAILKGHKALINTILFTDKNALFTAADENIIYYWEL